MTPRSLLFASLFITACAGTGTDADVDRGPIGKADILGGCSTDDCGGPSASGNCWCDDDCAEYGDCCPDKVDTCDTEAAFCGGHLGAACGEGEYCHYEQADLCGASDIMGTCQPVPFACTEIFMPVCGCDGHTYSNSCFAAAAGASVGHDGACDEPVGTDPAVCGGLANLGCPDGLTCADDPTDPCDPATGGRDCAGICVAE